MGDDVRLVVGIGLLLAGAAACGGTSVPAAQATSSPVISAVATAPPPPTPAYTLIITVTSEYLDTPIAGARVSVVGTDVQVLSDSAGHAYLNVQTGSGQGHCERRRLPSSLSDR